MSRGYPAFGAMGSETSASHPCESPSLGPLLLRRAANLAIGRIVNAWASSKMPRFACFLLAAPRTQYSLSERWTIDH
jgi:hypothetical protein